MKKYICPACKTKNKETLKYCRKCGTWLQDSIHPAMPAKGLFIGKIIKAILKVIGWLIVIVLLILAIVMVIGR